MHMDPPQAMSMILPTDGVLIRVGRQICCSSVTHANCPYSELPHPKSSPRSTDKTHTHHERKLNRLRFFFRILPPLPFRAKTQSTLEATLTMFSPSMSPLTSVASEVVSKCPNPVWPSEPHPQEYNLPRELKKRLRPKYYD